MKIVWNDKKFFDDLYQVGMDALIVTGNVLIGEAQIRAPKDKGQLRNSGHVHSVGDLSGNPKVSAGFTVEYAGIQEVGGDIYPVDAKALAVPIHKDAKDKSPRDFTDLIYIKRNGKPPLLVRKKGKGKIEPMYVLVKKVHIEGKHYLQGAAEDNLENIYKQVATQIRKGSKFIQ